MALINRIAISNILNINGDSPRADWSPRFQYEQLRFNGQSSAINLTNGGGKTTLAEAILAVLSRDSVLIRRTKEKLSPSASRVFSHVQIELIRPRASTAQSDLLTADGHDVDGDLWVFGMYGYRDQDDELSYYYYPGNLSDCTIGTAEGDKRQLTLNADFLEKLKAIRGCVKGSRRHEWHEALSTKTNLPPATLQQMVSFQKRPGDDKSALLLDVKTKPGESYAEAFFYKILAPAVMEGIMDREGEEDEVTLEDTVERAVYSTVKAKRDTEAYRHQTEELELGLQELEKVIRKAENAEEYQSTYKNRLNAIRQDASALFALVRGGHLIGVPKCTMPDGLLGQLASFIVVEPGSLQICILDRGLAALTNKEVGHLNETSRRLKIPERKVTQVLEIPCDLEIRRGGHKGSMYTIQEAISLLDGTLPPRKSEQLKEALEELESWFDRSAETNPLRARLLQDMQSLKQLKEDGDGLDRALGELHEAKTQLITQQQRMEANEGQYRALEESGLFSTEELEEPLATEKLVHQQLSAAQSAITEFNTKKGALAEYKPAWEQFLLMSTDLQDPSEFLELCRLKLKKLQEQLKQLRTDSEHSKNLLNKTNKELIEGRKAFEGSKKDADRIAEYRHAFRDFQGHFQADDPTLKEQELQEKQKSAEIKLRDLTDELAICQEGVDAVMSFQQTVDAEREPAVWLENAIAQRQTLVVNISDNKRLLADLQERRRALDKENVAANAATRRAQGLLSTNQLAFLPLHRFVENLSLPTERELQILSLFSSVLFAPVIEHPLDAVTAANILFDDDEQVPVFLASSLEAFCREGSVEMICDDTLAVAALAGVSTRAVECLIDPSLVAREKAALEDKAALVAAAIETLEEELSGITESAPKVLIARRAHQALLQGEPTRLTALKETIEVVAVELQALEALCTIPMKNMMRRAAEYVRLGGEIRDFALQQRMQELSEQNETLEEQLRTLELQVEAVEVAIATKADEVDQTLPAKLENLLERAVCFQQKGGPDFFVALEDTEVRLTAALEHCNKRYRYSGHFSAAQAFLDNLSKDIGKDDLATRIAHISRELSEKDKTRQEVRNNYHRLDSTLPMLRQALMDIDRAAIATIGKYRQIAQLEDDIQEIDACTAHPLMELAKNLTRAIATEDNHTISQESRNFAAEIEELHIERKASELRAAQQNAISAEKAFIEQATTAARVTSALKPVELSILEQATSIEAAIKIRNLYHSLLDTFQTIKGRLDECAMAELEARRNVSSRLAHLIAMTKYDFDIMRQVMKENRGAHVSHFNIEAKILDLDDGKRLIESIIEDVDFLEKQRRDRLKANAGETNENDFHDQIKDKLRSKLYKSIFSNPQIYYTNETIRSAQKNNEFTDKLSEGQKAAMSLMWMIRLAEFAIERSAKRMSGRSAQRKVRERAENIIIIDGLFSNLSDRHLIDSTMSGIESTRGRFQLIGLIHNPHYQNDFSKFPVFIIGKNRGRTGGKAGWVSFKNEPTPLKDIGSVGFAQLRKVTDMENP